MQNKLNESETCGTIVLLEKTLKNVKQQTLSLQKTVVIGYSNYIFLLRVECNQRLIQRIDICIFKKPAALPSIIMILSSFFLAVLVYCDKPKSINQ